MPTLITAARIRIVLRYVAGAAVSYGLASPATAEAVIANPHVIAIAGGLLGLGAEWAYARAIRLGLARP